MKTEPIFRLLPWAVVLMMLLTPLQTTAGEAAALSKGQTVYVPAYSHIYHGNSEKPFFLTVTLSIRNVDAKRRIKLTAVDYYETQGMLLKNYIKAPILLKPLESVRYIVAEKDELGGSGANFIVEWQSEKPVNPPIIETVMISSRLGQGISFTSRARVIIESPE